ncbi:MAG: T9SS type A sorting domain-containing protein [Spirosomataceae bacterium]
MKKSLHFRLVSIALWLAALWSPESHATNFSLSKSFDNPAGTTTPVACIGTPIQLTATGGISYSWNGPNDFSSEEQDPTFTATSTAMGGVYSVTITDGQSNSALFTVSVQVRSEVLEVQASSNTPCTGSTLQLSAITSAVVSYSWSGPNGFFSTEQNPQIPAFTYDKVGYYTLNVSALNSCSTFARVYAQTNRPEAEIKVIDPTCNKDGSITFSISRNSSQWQVSMSRSFGGTDFGVGGTKPIPYTPFGPSATVSIPKGGRPRTEIFINYILKHSAGCPNLQNTLPAIPDPVVGCCPSVTIFPSSTTLCQGKPFTLTSEIYPFGSAYAWKGPNGFSSSAQEVSAIAGSTGPFGIYSLSVTAGSCTVTSTAEVKPLFQAGVVGTPCVGGTIQFTASGLTSYSWSRPTNKFSSTLQNPVIPSSTINDAGIYFLSASSNSCVVTTMIPVMLTGSGINPSFSVSPSSFAAGATVALSAASATGTYSWSGPNGFSGSTRTKSISNFQVANNGVYRLTLTSGTCRGYTEKTIAINSATRLAATEIEPLDMEINAYPNPVGKTLTVEVRLKEPSALQLNLLNSVGKPSGAWQLNEVSPFHKTELNLADLQGGVYLLQAQADKQKVVKRVVKIQY